MNGYNFTEQVRRVLAMTREVASRLHHEYVGTEHILLGIIADGDGVPAAVFHNIGIDVNALAARVESAVKPGNAEHQTGPDLPYTSRAKKVLELAMQEARDRHHGYVGSEHLLIGLLREEKSIAAQVLTEFGATLEVVRHETTRLIGTAVPRKPEPAPTGSIAGITVEVRLADGSTIRGSFRSVEGALHFLKNVGDPLSPDGNSS